MSSTKLRISQFADEVKAAGLKGESMQTVLEKVAQREDLSAEEVHRVAEIANKNVSLTLHKTAKDKRFKFDLADPKVAVANIRDGKQASKTAGVAPASFEQSYDPTIAAHDAAMKTASVLDAIDGADGDPFAAPIRDSKNFSIYDAPIAEDRFEKLASENQDVQDRTALFELNKVATELKLVDEVNSTEMVKVAAAAVEHESSAIQAMMDLVEANIPLPDLYAATVATCTEPETDPERCMETADEIFGLVIDGLRKRGVSVAKMGFRDYYNPVALEKLSTDDLINYARGVCGYGPGKTCTISMDDAKFAEAKTAEEVYSEARPKDGGEFVSAHMWDSPGSPEDILRTRGSVADHQIAPSRVEDAKNRVGGVRVINGNHAFVIAIRGLMGDQRRMVNLHGSREYLGLKLKQITEAINEMAGIREARNA